MHAYSQKILYGLAATLLSFVQQAQAETPYDYYPASQCHAYEGSYADAEFGFVMNTLKDTIVDIVCPIVRIYPRTPNRLTFVRVSLSKSDEFPSASRLVSVCAKGYWHGKNAVCETKSIFKAGFQTITFDKNDLADIINVPWGWAHYMYITVQQYPSDELYGYETDFDLQ